MVTDSTPRADEGYLIVADISGYTAWMAAVGKAHQVDVSDGIPPGFTLLQVMLASVTQGLAPLFSVEGLEGDAVFGVAPSGDLDGRGDALVRDLRALYAAFLATRNEWHGRAVVDHYCIACPLVSTLDLKMILHEGPFVRQSVRGRDTVVGPAVNEVHRLLKNSIADSVGYRHYLFLTDAAAGRLGLRDAGAGHSERYPDIGEISGRVLELDSDD